MPHGQLKVKIKSVLSSKVRPTQRASAPRPSAGIPLGKNTLGDETQAVGQPIAIKLSQMKKRATIFLLLNILFLFSCASKSEQRKTQLDIFKSSSCNLPCWNGIIVSNTTEQKLISTLNSLSIVNKDSLGSLIESSSIFEKSYSLKFGEKDNNGQFPGFSYIYIKSGTVQGMEFVGGFELTVNEAIDIFDEPKYVFTTHTHSGKLDIRLFFPQKGAIISLTKSKRSADISGVDMIEMIEIISPDIFDSFVDDRYTFGSYKYDFYNWEGFGNILEKYYPQ
jgi:hypothetical protein